MGHSDLKNRSAILAGLGVLFLTPAWADETKSSDPSRDEVLAEVVVTGTRLHVAQADATSPVIVLDRRELERGAADSVAKVLRGLPMNTGSTANTSMNAGGNGSSRVDLRGLGPERTLVLLNGRRFPNGGVGGDASVDLNAIPTSWIDRIEVLASGASAVYGADAVGGVVNIITRPDFEGAELGGTWTITGRGDGEITRGQAAIGFGVLEGNVVDLRSLSRRFIEQPTRGFSQDVDLWRAVAGVEGELKGWRWKLTAGNARSDIANVERGLVLGSRLVAALGPSGPDGSGRIVCGVRDPVTGRVPPANVIPDCVPLNLFGGAGTITQEQLDYLSVPLRSSGTNEQETAEAVLSGRWGRLRGHDLQWVFGAEYRRESGSLVADPVRIRGTAGEVVQDLPVGAFDARELFGEVQVPLLRDRWGAHDLTVNFGARWSKFSSFDRNTAGQAALRWRPTAAFTLRASYAEVFRAPSLMELYQSRAVAAEAGTDPCGNDPTAIQQVHCAANGVPTGAYVQEEEAIATLLGGSADLGPEQGRGLGAGVTWAPAWARALTATVDVFDIELTDFIGRANLSEVLLECAERGAAAVCDTISRFPDGSVSRVSLEARNFGRLETRGVDLSVDVRSRAGAAHVNGRLLATYLARWDDQPFPGGEVFQRAGQLRFHDLPRVLPRWRASGHLDWQSGRWTASYSAEYIGSFAECGDGGIFLLETDCRRVASEILHDIEGGYAFDSGFALRAGLTNLTDEDPPFVNNHFEANTDPGTYRMLGRTYFLQLRYAVR